MIAVVDYGVGNLGSVGKAFSSLDAGVQVTSDPREVRKARAVVLPGVGAYRDAMDSLKQKGLKEPVLEAIREGRPFLGICLGLQLLFDSSEEHAEHGDLTPGLGVFPGQVRRFEPDELPDGKLKIPHMGWNSISIQKSCPLFEGIADGTYFYFVHSYYLKAGERDVVAATTWYGRDFDAAIAAGKVYATQFHPEKSGVEGLRVLKNFIAIAQGG
ncbi:MAG TPA: imidazole glycerol phosphate synthase subunit HisH [Clostridiales bacterium]|nr:imidazole glycerol phosphate synthase subunit HisH [Clostridiales bacterium]